MLILKRSALTLLGLFLFGLTLMTIATNLGDARSYGSAIWFFGYMAGILSDELAIPLYIMGLFWIANGSVKLRNWMFGYIAVFLVAKCLLTLAIHS